MPKRRVLAPFALAAIAFGALLGGKIHPFGNPNTEDSGQHLTNSMDRKADLWPLLTGAKAIDPATLHLLERSCQNCHSEKTVWPWYGRIAPGSWLLERDVMLARERFNLSRWDSYTPEQRAAFLSAIGAAVRTGEMPPARYLLMHPGASLSTEERLQIYDWTRLERQHKPSLNLTPTGAIYQ